MANIKVIAEHSVDIDLLSCGVCIDAGCRGFLFSYQMRDLGCKVLAFDLEVMKAPEGVMFQKGAIGIETKMVQYVNTNDPQAKYISNFGEWVMGYGLNDIYNGLSAETIDILKLDIEGSEYLVLSDPNFQPIPKQISVEFHMHAHRKLHDQYYEACMVNLLKHYEPVRHELTQAHGAGENYWDSLFIRKDLL